MVTLLVGTRKGLFTLTGDDERTGWEVAGPAFAGWHVNSVDHDSRTGTTYAAVTSEMYGPVIARSDDLGRTWDQSSEGFTYGEGGDELRGAWAVRAGLEPGVVYAGARPAGLFRSADGGKTWSELAALRTHPTAEHWSPGAAGLILHTIVPHPTDPNVLWAGISAAGVYHTSDGGESWEPRNAGINAPWEGREPPVAGQCCHKFRLAGASATRLFQQNHVGQFRSDDGGVAWQPIQQGLPSEFGFPVVTHPRDDDTAWFLPLVGAEHRFVPDGVPVVYRTRDGGASYESLAAGLPTGHAHLVILRDAMATDDLDPVGVYFGTSTGQVFASPDEGDTWRLAADFLPPVYAVHAVA